VGGADRLCAILDQPETSALGQLSDFVHWGGVPKKMNRHDRASPRGDGRLDLTDVEVARVLVHVDEYRPGSNVEHGVCRRHEGEWTRDHLVAWSDAIRDQRQVQRCCARAGGYCVLHSDLLGKTAFQLRHSRSLNEHSRLEHVENGSLLSISDQRSGDWDIGLHGWWSHW